MLFRSNAVRLALADLPPDEVDELTDGLEADLDERAQDEATPVFGDPLAYANELRAAAGLPARSNRRPRTGGGLSAAWRSARDALNGFAAHPNVARVVAFFLALRPLWWIVRAWVFYGILTWLLSGLAVWLLGAPSLRINALQLTPVTFVVGALSLISSVQFGRGKWMPRKWMRKALLVTNILLVVGSPLIVSATTSAWNSAYESAYNSGQRNGVNQYDGLNYDGRQVTNIFAFDASGNALTQVQLYDQNGRPLYTVPEPWDFTLSNPFLVPNANVQGRGGWNVFPLGYLTADQVKADGHPKPNQTPTPSVLHDFVAPPLKNAKSSGVPSGAATPTPTPTATPAP